MSKKRFDPCVLFFLFVAIVVTIFLISGPRADPDKETSQLPTTYSKSRNGMKGLYLVLEGLDKDTRRWKRPLALLKGEEIGTLVVTNPRKPLSPKEKEALDIWFLQEGQMILLHDGDWEIKASGYNKEIQSFKEVFNEQPKLSVFQDRLKLTNDELKNNPKRALSIIQQIFSHPGPVYFDEYHLNNGETTSSWVLIKQYCTQPIGWLTLHLVALFFLYILCTPNSGNMGEENNKKKVDLIQARASFLELSQARKFANQVISKYRRNKNGEY